MHNAAAFVVVGNNHHRFACVPAPASNEAATAAFPTIVSTKFQIYVLFVPTSSALYSIQESLGQETDTENFHDKRATSWLFDMLSSEFFKRKRNRKGKDNFTKEEVNSFAVKNQIVTVRDLDGANV